MFLSNLKRGYNRSSFYKWCIKKFISEFSLELNFALKYTLHLTLKLGQKTLIKNVILYYSLLQFLLIWYILFLKLIIYLAAASLVEAYLTVSASPQVVGLVPCSTLPRMTEIFCPWVCNAVLCPCQGTGYHLVTSLDNKILCACQIWKGSERNIKKIICFQAGMVMNPTIRLVLTLPRSQ